MGTAAARRKRVQTETLVMRISAPLYADLRAFAAADDRPVAQVVRRAISDHITARPQVAQRPGVEAGALPKASERGPRAPE